MGRRTPHAYVFHGPEGVGREMLARAFARVLLCPHAAEQPLDSDATPQQDFGNTDSLLEACGNCPACTMMSADSHPDFHLIHRELIQYHPNPEVRKRKALALSVDVIRTFLIDAASTRPAQGRAKVFVVREAELMNQAAQNALLKTLEEPPPDTYIILLSVSAERLLDTTRSRCQTVPFAPLPVDFVRDRLAEQAPELSGQQAHFLAAVHEGRLGPALRAASESLHNIKTALLDSTLALAPGKAGQWARGFEDAAVALAENLSANRPGASNADLKRSAVRALLGSVSYAFDDALRARAGFDAPPAHADQPDLARKLGGRLDTDSACRALGHLAAAEANIDRNVNLTLCLEGLAAELIACLSAPST